MIAGASSLAGSDPAKNAGSETPPRIQDGPGMLGEFGVIVVCSGWTGEKAVVVPGRSAQSR